MSNIVVFDTYTFQRLGVLISHTALVKSISWSADDFRLVSAGIDGAVYEWALQGFTRAEVSYSLCTVQIRVHKWTGGSLRMRT